MDLKDLVKKEDGVGKIGFAPTDAPTATLRPRVRTPSSAGPPRRDMTAPRMAASRGHSDQPVEPYLFPKDGNHPFTEKVLPAAVAKVDAIRDQALALGWSEARLYQNRGRLRFPFGGDYGLVCFIGEDKRVGEVAKHHIEILVGSPPRESRLRFYNPDVDRQWLSLVPMN